MVAESSSQGAAKRDPKAAGTPSSVFLHFLVRIAKLCQGQTRSITRRHKQYRERNATTHAHALRGPQPPTAASQSEDYVTPT